MDKISVIAITGIFFTIFTTSANAQATCSDITQEFYTYDKGLPASATNVFPYPWQDMTWILAKLGPATTMSNFTETRAIWKKYNFGITENNGNVATTEGQKPAAVIPDSNIQQTSRVLGQPDFIQTANMTQYNWACETNSSLSVTSNNSAGQIIVSYKGTYCTTSTGNQSCQNFSNYKVAFPEYKNIGVGLQKADLYIQHPPLQPQYTDAQALQVANSETLQSISKQMHTPILDMAKLQELATEGLINYYAKLSQCSPGSYQYLYPFILGGKLISTNEVAPYFYFAIAKIQGMHDQKCIVTMTAKIGKNNGSMNCQYPADILNQFTQEKAVFDSTNQSNFNPVQVDQSKMFLKYCQVYLNGALVPTT